eukprot:comp21873_c0_seq2/m.49548 comp21873_c0_seq2/g.49548  ORF comp21873_c0_seq2/g.49548 comp21873_c0_seq2/m.49548 type:complete len:313 (-) comp21873_c0_seq2:1004-1942(-)
MRKLGHQPVVLSDLVEIELLLRKHTVGAPFQMIHACAFILPMLAVERNHAPCLTELHFGNVVTADLGVQPLDESKWQIWNRHAAHIHTRTKAGPLDMGPLLVRIHKRGHQPLDCIGSRAIVVVLLLRWLRLLLLLGCIVANHGHHDIGTFELLDQLVAHDGREALPDAWGIEEMVEEQARELAAHLEIDESISNDFGGVWIANALLKLAAMHNNDANELQGVLDIWEQNVAGLVDFANVAPERNGLFEGLLVDEEVLGQIICVALDHGARCPFLAPLDKALVQNIVEMVDKGALGLAGALREMMHELLHKPV